MAPAGRVHTAIPTTKMEIGSVASAGLGASVLPTMAPVAYTTTAFAPASAWATDSRKTLPSSCGYRLAVASPVLVLASAWDMGFLRLCVERADARPTRFSRSRISAPPS